MDGKSRSPLYQRRFWKKRRNAHLAKEPLCRYCLKFKKKIRKADVVDHIVPWTTTREFYTGRLQSLCHAHHNEKTATEDRDYNKRKRLLEIKDF